MTTIYQIESAVTVHTLNELVESFTSEQNCELDDNLTYAENAEWFDQNPNRDGVPAMAEMLRSAETRWHQLEDPHNPANFE